MPESGPRADTPVMIDDCIAPYRLAITIGSLTLRLVRPEELPQLAAVARLPLYEDEGPAAPAAAGAWTMSLPDRRARGTLQGHLAAVGSWRPEDWQCPFGVWRGSDLFGVQSLNARDFASSKTVYTGSWLALPYQGHGVGTAMRAAALAFAFASLGATTAWTRAGESAEASARISQKLGYEHVGDDVESDAEGRPRHLRRFELTAERWRATARPAVTVTGLDAAVESWFGITPAAAPSTM